MSADLGYSAGDIDKMIADKVVRSCCLGGDASVAIK